MAVDVPFTAFNLQQVCAHLSSTLYKHGQYLKLEIDQLDGKIASEQAASKNKEDEKFDLGKKKAKAEARLAFLDSKELEKLEPSAIQGQTAFHRPRKYTSPLPEKFRFSLQSKYPIRDHGRAKDLAVTWSALGWWDGAPTFTVTVKTKPLKEAEAEVTLFGWRKEIHAAEILTLRAEIKRLGDAIAVCDATIGRLGREVDLLRTRKQPWITKLGLCRDDVQNVDRALSSGISKYWEKEYLEVGSISGFAFRLGLKSKDEMERATRWSHPLLFETLELCHREAEAARELHERQVDGYRDMGLSYGTVELEINSKLGTSLSRRQDFSQAENRTKKVIGVEPEESEFNKECKSDIDIFKKDLAEPLDKLVKELKASPSKLPGNSVLIMKNDGECLKQQVAALKLVSKELYAEAKPIGVAATLQAAESYRNRGELVLSMYQGKRLNLARGLE
ncbi:hypothetical protein B0H66DRAFT_542507 [Apodospora peruviana]|uniref:Uncharacterized protein n=1 Tax=Apodospora peruviana TaxID=516989 RepID=A0AAE0IRU9_9PEZI|nr:hypothetical protein B0H66DRAFT_542507 [Apodospora peruviana]